MDASSLADLKAEVARKRNEAKTTKIHSKDPRSKPDPIWASKKKPTESSSKNSAHVDLEEERRVQSALELKARLYNKMKSGEVEDTDGRFLINFKKTKEGSDSSDDDERLPELLSEDGRREMLRQKWEEEEEENMKKSSLHYNDVLFDEARTHGAAFYSFSRDESTREKELEELQRMHQETKKAREEKEKQKVDKKEALKNRLKKVRDRKRLKMGLPILPDDDDDVTDADGQKKDEEPQEAVENPEDLILQRLKEIREKEDDAKRKAIVREWDVGKKGGKAAAAAASPFGASSSTVLTSKPAEAKVFSQKEWVEKKRSERPQEFAPPVNFLKDSGPKRTVIKPKNYSAVPPPASHQPGVQHQRDQWPQQNLAHRQQQQQQHQPNLARQGQQQPPQETVDYQQPHFNQNHPVASGSIYDVGNYASAQEGDATTHDALNESFEAPRTASISKSSRLEMHRQMNEGSFGQIVNEVTDAPIDAEPSLSSSSSTSAGVTGSSRGVEIPPPCSFDYYTSAANKRSNWKGSRTRDELSEAFQFGIDQWKKRKKMTSPDSDDDDENV